MVQDSTSRFWILYVHIFLIFHVKGKNIDYHLKCCNYKIRSFYFLSIRCTHYNLYPNTIFPKCTNLLWETWFYFILVPLLAGTNSFIWLGPRSSVIVTDPELVKDVLTKNYIYQKAKNINPLTKLLAQGLVSYDADKWDKHRKIINPAFYLEKLKVFSSSNVKFT